MGLLDRPLDVSHPDALLLLDFLRKTFQTTQEVRALALEAGVDLGFIVVDQPVALLWQEVTITAARQGRLRLLVERVRVHPNSAQGQTLLGRLINEPPEPEEPPVPVGAALTGIAGPAAAPPPATPVEPAAMEPPAPIPDEVFETALLWDDLPFIDRTHLRSNLHQMLTGQARRALLVMGEEGAGKTYTRQFIHYLGDHGGPQCVKAIDMSMRAGAPIDVRELASLVANTVVGMESPTFDPTAQPETVVSRFVPWLADEVRQQNQAVWLVLDGFTPTTATGGALQLVDAVARAAANRDLGPLRVVVLGYSGNPASAGLALTEPIGHPTRDDVKVFFRRAALALQGAEPDDEALDELLDTLGPIDTKPIAELGPSAMIHARAVFGVT